MTNKNKVAIIGGLVFVDRYFTSELFQKEFNSLSSRNSNLEIDYYSKVLKTVEEFSKRNPSSKFKIKHISLSFSFKAHRISNHFRKLRDYCYDYSESGSLTRRYFYENMGYEKRLVHGFDFKVFSLLNSRGIRQFLDFIVAKICILLRSNDVKSNVNWDDYDSVYLCWPYAEHNQNIAAELVCRKVQFSYIYFNFDNLTTKPRVIYKPKKFLVWGHRNAEEVKRFYQNWNPDIKIIGNPNYEIFDYLSRNANQFDDKLLFNSLESINSENGKLNHYKYRILWALGSPNLFDETSNLIHFITHLPVSISSKIELIIRPHPAFDFEKIKVAIINEIENRNEFLLVKFQNSNNLIEADYQNSDSVKLLFDTFKYCDLVINTTSTIGIDALYFKLPVLNICYSVTEDKKNTQNIVASNNLWEHYSWILTKKAILKIENENQLFRTLEEFILGSHFDSQTMIDDRNDILSELSNYPMKNTSTSERIIKELIN